MRQKRLACVALATIALVGCGTTPSGTDGGAGGGTAAAGGGSAGGGSAGGGSAGGGSAGGGSAGGAGGPTTQKTGAVNIYQLAFDAGSGVSFVSSGASAYFSTTTLPAGFSNPCTTVDAGSCSTTTCAISISTADSGIGSMVDSAGTVSIAGTLFDGGISMTPGIAGVYSFSAQSLLWVGATQLTISGDGGTAPAFSAVLTTPTLISVSAPACAAGACGSASRSSPLALAWTGGGTSTVYFSMGQVSSNQAISTVCTYPASAASAMVPAAVLGAFNAGMATISLNTQSTATTTAGSYAVTLNATYQTTASGQITLQ